jgi:hypothetical protein
MTLGQVLGYSNADFDRRVLTDEGSDGTAPGNESSDPSGATSSNTLSAARRNNWCYRMADNLPDTLIRRPINTSYVERPRLNRLLRVKATVITPDSGFLWFDGRRRGK